MKRFLLSGFAFAVLAVGTAVAADLPTKAPQMVTPVSYNWTGPYFGIEAGGGWLRDDLDMDDPNSSHSGGLIGGTLGYNFQTPGPWLWGLEGDIGYFSKTDQKYLGTVRGRIGYATGQFLPYITGGLAVMSDDGNANAGWTIGAGLEYALMQNISIKGEYLYVDTHGLVAGSILRVGVNWRFN